MGAIVEKQSISFTVYGEPVAQGRPRASTAGGFVRLYDPQKSRDYKDYVRLVASEHAPSKLIEGPLQLKVNVYRPIPKSFSKKKAAQAEAGELRPTSKPDADNYLKGIKDALKNVVWKDDSQVVEVSVSKWYSDRPRVEVQILEI
ncbi:RusA family crossover junction endodeoxyribonuclease [Brevibacillus sp. LEMMJ03]|jgi:Holliday junction resolvase RusA-like endonuclease|uniref:RusA family crossover junction endodeoxyribonuclease n=1 Tax=Brevibacillus sp. LEMMJ03 TaxID=2595056 RepID=UPI00117EB9F2|nr:RusA family crossover junction endodeoxyribonuclease [Brevibacillus sp. LEMMJ03]TRY25943.1 RusA family crossover junction endodeoxyribonuclease [Brevibacillus sp. LEMMJ03]